LNQSVDVFQSLFLSMATASAVLGLKIREMVKAPSCKCIPTFHEFSLIGERSIDIQQEINITVGG
jgi:hypothetical protein